MKPDAAEEFLKKHDPFYNTSYKRDKVTYNYHSYPQLKDKRLDEIPYSNLSLKQKLHVQAQKMQPNMIREDELV